MDEVCYSSATSPATLLQTAKGLLQSFYPASSFIKVVAMI